MPRSPDNRIQRNLGDPGGMASLLADIRKPKLEPETGWHRIGASAGYETGVYFKNSWNAVNGATLPDPSFYLSESGEVRSRGRVNGGSVGSVIFTFPEECRPEYAESFICRMVGGWANLEVSPNGDVTLIEFGGN